MGCCLVPPGAFLKSSSQTAITLLNSTLPHTELMRMQWTMDLHFSFEINSMRNAPVKVSVII